MKDYVDASGAYRNFGEDFIDCNGNWCRWGDGFYDYDGNYIRWGNTYKDSSGAYRRWGEDFIDGAGNWIHVWENYELCIIMDFYTYNRIKLVHIKIFMVLYLYIAYYRKFVYFHPN